MSRADLADADAILDAEEQNARRARRMLDGCAMRGLTEALAAADETLTALSHSKALVSTQREPVREALIKVRAGRAHLETATPVTERS